MSMPADDGKAIQDVTRSVLQSYSQTEKDQMLVDSLLYLWLIALGIEPSPENARKYLNTLTLRGLLNISKDLAAMKRAQKESP